MQPSPFLLVQSSSYLLLQLPRTPILLSVDANMPEVAGSATLTSSVPGNFFFFTCIHGSSFIYFYKSENMMSPLKPPLSAYAGSPKPPLNPLSSPKPPLNPMSSPKGVSRSFSSMLNTFINWIFIQNLFYDIRLVNILAHLRRLVLKQLLSKLRIFNSYYPLSIKTMTLCFNRFEAHLKHLVLQLLWVFFFNFFIFF